MICLCTYVHQWWNVSDTLIHTYVHQWRYYCSESSLPDEGDYWQGIYRYGSNWYWTTSHELVSSSDWTNWKRWLIRLCLLQSVCLYLNPLPSLSVTLFSTAPFLLALSMLNRVTRHTAQRNSFHPSENCHFVSVFSFDFYFIIFHPSHRDTRVTETPESPRHPSLSSRRPQFEYQWQHAFTMLFPYLVFFSFYFNFQHVSANDVVMTITILEEVLICVLISSLPIMHAAGNISKSIGNLKAKTSLLH